MKNQSTAAKDSRRLTKRLSALLFGLLASIGLVFGTSIAANAVSLVSVTPDSGLSSSDTVEVQVTFDEDDAYFAIAECNTAYGAGLACDENTAIGLLPTPGVGTYTYTLDVNSDFDNTSFVPTDPGPGGHTYCLDATVDGDQCAVYVSTYDSTGSQVSDDSINITFN